MVDTLVVELLLVEILAIELLEGGGLLGKTAGSNSRGMGILPAARARKNEWALRPPPDNEVQYCVQ